MCHVSLWFCMYKSFFEWVEHFKQHTHTWYVFFFFSMTIKINVSLASELRRQAETQAHVHSSNSNKEPIVGSTCLHKSPLCSWVGASVAKWLFITPTASLCRLPLRHVRLLPSLFISMQCLCLKRRWNTSPWKSRRCWFWLISRLPCLTAQVSKIQ